jgi:hypothetical protein
MFFKHCITKKLSLIHIVYVSVQLAEYTVVFQLPVVQAAHQGSAQQLPCSRWSMSDSLLRENWITKFHDHMV